LTLLKKIHYFQQIYKIKTIKPNKIKYNKKKPTQLSVGFFNFKNNFAKVLELWQSSNNYESASTSELVREVLRLRIV